MPTNWQARLRTRRRNGRCRCGLCTAASGACNRSGHGAETESLDSRIHRLRSEDRGRISSGKIRGFNRRGIFIFRGIPYGDSTSGANRFMAPKPAKPWAGIRDTLQFGHACIQPGSDSAHYNYDGGNRAPSDAEDFLLHRGEGILVPGEDCLHLNVWTPALRDLRRRPVMVFMHGGGFEAGFDFDLGSYDGESSRA